MPLPMNLSRYLFTALPLVLTALPVQAGPVNYLVVPNAQASTAGNDIGGDLSAMSNVDFRFQQVYGSSEFSSVPGSLLITQFAFRVSPGTGSMAVTGTGFAVYMSTSPYAPNSAGGNTLIHSTFADNPGPDNTLVFSSGAGTMWSSPGCAGPGPCPFDMVFTLTTPFLYNPSRGSLLLDLQGFGASGESGAHGSFDVESFTSPGGSAGTVSFVGTGSPTGQVELSGNVVQLGYTVAPEPASYTAMLCGLGILGALRRRRSA